MAELRPLTTYIAAHRVLHDNHEYKPGDEVRIADEETVAQLRKLGALKLPLEIEPPENVAARMARQEAEIEELRAALAAAMAESAGLAAASGGAKASGKASGKAAKAEELAPPAE